MGFDSELFLGPEDAASIRQAAQFVDLDNGRCFVLFGNDIDGAGSWIGRTASPDSWNEAGRDRT
jgi:hypothetical protein